MIRRVLVFASRVVRDWWADRDLHAVLLDGAGDVRPSHVVPEFTAEGRTLGSLFVGSGRLVLGGDAEELRALARTATRLADWCQAADDALATAGSVGPAELGIPRPLWQDPIPAPVPSLWDRIVAGVAVLAVVWAVTR